MGLHLEPGLNLGHHTEMGARTGLKFRYVVWAASGAGAKCCRFGLHLGFGLIWVWVLIKKPPIN